MDLTRDLPRSPYASLGGIVFLPRAIDKARAEAADALGEYMSRRGFSVDLFEFLGVDVDGFHAAVAAWPPTLRTPLCWRGSRPIWPSGRPTRSPPGTP